MTEVNRRKEKQQKIKPCQERSSTRCEGLVLIVPVEELEDQDVEQRGVEVQEEMEDKG